MARKIIICVVIVACAAGAAFMLMRKASQDGVGDASEIGRSGEIAEAEATPGAKRISNTKRHSTTNSAAARRAAHSVTQSVDWLEALPEKDRKLASAVQDALDGDDFTNVLRAAESAMSSTNSEVRIAAIEALGFFGENALVELMPYMADKDEEVAQAARDAWEMALSEVESPKERLNAAIMVLETITDKDSLAMIASQLSNTATELIDATSNGEKSQARREEILLAIETIIKNGKPVNADAAREAYEEITGHEWVSTAETKLYLSDPDNYETPEERAASAAAEAAEVAKVDGATETTETDGTDGMGSVPEATAAPVVTAASETAVASGTSTTTSRRRSSSSRRRSGSSGGSSGTGGSGSLGGTGSSGDSGDSGDADADVSDTEVADEAVEVDEGGELYEGDEELEGGDDFEGDEELDEGEVPEEEVPVEGQ